MLNFFLVAHLTYENHWGKWHSKIRTFGFFGTPYCSPIILRNNYYSFLVCYEWVILMLWVEVHCWKTLWREHRKWWFYLHLIFLLQLWWRSARQTEGATMQNWREWDSLGTIANFCFLWRGEFALRKKTWLSLCIMYCIMLLVIHTHYYVSN